MNVRPWPGPAVVIRAPSPATAPAVAPPDDSAARRKALDARIRQASRRATAGAPLAAHLGLADLYRQRAAVALPARAQAFEDRAHAVLKALVADPRRRGQPGFDDALFLYGSRLLARDPAEGRKVMAELIRDFPRSPRVADSFLAFADYYFDQGDLANAERFYRKVMTLDSAVIGDYATYKLAWTSWNLGDGTSALELLVRLLRSRTPGDASQRLRDQAMKDLPRFYAQVGAANRAAAFFARLDAGAEVEHLDRLADAYEDMGKYDQSIVAYVELAARAPSDPRVCVWWQGAARSAEAVGDLDRVVAHSRALIAAPSCSAEPAVRDTVGRLARRLHTEAAATADRAATERAATLYRAYLQHAPGSADADLVRFYLAHLSWDAALAERQPATSVTLWTGLAADCARAAGGGLVPDDRTAAAACAVAAISNALAVADAFELRAPEVLESLRLSLDAVAAAASAPDRVRELQQRLAQ